VTVRLSVFPDVSKESTAFILQGLIGPRRLTCTKTPRNNNNNNNNPATTRHIPEDMNAQDKLYPVRP
jgi:hypothetical protein